MADKPRSLSAALKITPEVQDFIQRGDDAPRPAAKPLVEQSQVEVKSKPIKIKVVSERSGEHQRENNKVRRKQAPKSDKTLLSLARVAITTRFRQEVADSLRRASLERKLRGESPHSQQDIIESAVAAWLRTVGKAPANSQSTD